MQWTCLAVHQLLLLLYLTVIKGMEPTISGDILKFTRQPDSRIYVPNNSSFLVPCEAAGKQPLSRYWRNESVLNSRVVINTTSKGLWFTNGVQRSGSSGVHRVGIFRCMASDTAGVLMSKKFELSSIYLQNISVHLSSPALFNNIVRLKCSAGTNQPVKYTWFKDNIVLNASRDSRLEVLSSGVLRIKDYRVSDNGNYSCRAQNEYKFITSRGVKVFGQSASKTSVHIYPGKIIHTTVGSPLVIECIQYSPQTSSVAWSKLTRKLVTGAGYVNLVFDSVQQSDAGQYRCLATDGVEETVRVSVGVSAPPSFTTRLPAKTELREGKRLVLTCHVSGNPTPSVTWYKDGRVLAENSRIRFHGNGSEHRLVVNNVAFKNTGVYQCEIENKYGSSIDQTILNVIDKMDPPRNVRGYALSPTKVNITWEIPPGYNTVYFVVHIKDYVTNSDFEQVIQKRHATHLVVDSLRPYSDYGIYVQLYADHRARGRSSAFFVRTLETRPSGTPNEVELTSYSYGTLDITWLPPFIMQRNGLIISYEVKYFIEGDNKEGNSKEHNLTITKNFHSTTLMNLVPGKKNIVTENLYATTLRNLVPGKKYIVKIAARTTAGLGPFLEKTSSVMSKTSVGAVIPAPPVIIKNINKSSVVLSVTPPPKAHIKGYQLTYKFMGAYMGEEVMVIKNETAFDYVLKNIEMNLEYVIRVVAFGSGMTYGRPKIILLARNVPKKLNHTMFGTSNYTYEPRLNISCEPILNSTAIAVKWEQATEHVPEFEVKYNIYNMESSEVETILTKHLNVTIHGVLPGEIYDVQIRTVFRRHPGIYTYRLPESELCSVPEKKPSTPPSGITCNIFRSVVVVTWRGPTEPNGKIRHYNIMWHGAENETMKSEKAINILSKSYSFTMENVKRDPKFVVYLSAENSVGKSPNGHCIIDTSNIPTVPPKSNDEPEKHNTGDIEKGIIIGCIISVLVLCILVMFVCWSGCRRHKKRTQTKENGTPYYNSRTSQYPDTVSTEVSELSTKHHQIVKKFIDEETSKESDRGVGMTPKNSRLYLDSEKIPFLPKAVNQDGSVDTSCDSQDSGVQGLGKKLSPAPGALKDPDKTPLQHEDCVVETTC